MKNIYFIFLLAPFLLNCKGKITKSEKTIPECIIDVKNSPATVDISYLFKPQISAFKLETRNECLLSSVQKIQFYDDYLFISDNTSQCVFQFSNSGKFIRRIGHRGKAPDEYSYMGDFIVTNQQVYISDLYENRIFCYNLTNDSITTIPLSIKIDEMFHLNSDTLFCISNNRDNGDNRNKSFNLYKVNLTNSTTEGILPADDEIIKHHSTWGLNRYASTFKNQAALIYPLNDTIYKVTANNVMPQMIVHFSERSLPENAKYQDVMQTMKQSSQYILGMNNIRDLGNVLFFEYGDQELQKGVIIDKKTYKSINSERFVLNTWGGLYLTDFEIHNDELYIIQPAYMFKTLWENIYSKNRFADNSVKSTLNKLYNETSEDDNPIVFKLEIKD